MMRGHIVRNMTGAAPLALLALIGCSGDYNPVGPQGVHLPPHLPPATGLSGTWSVTIVSTSGETHQGDLQLEQQESSVQGAIEWGWGVEGLLGDPWDLRGNVSGQELTFQINEDACWWDGGAGPNDGAGTATVTADGQRMEGGFRITPLCGQEQPQDWNFSATKR